MTGRLPGKVAIITGAVCVGPDQSAQYLKSQQQPFGAELKTMMP